MELLPASQYVFINGVRAWTLWNNGRHQQHFIIRERLLAKFIIFNI